MSLPNASKGCQNPRPVNAARVTGGVTAAPTATATSPGPDPAVTSPRGPRQLRGPFPLPGLGGQRGPSRGAVLPSPAGGEAGAGRAVGPRAPDGNTSLLTRCGFRAIAVRASLFCQEPGAAPAALPVPGHGATGGTAEPPPARSERGAAPQRCHRRPLSHNSPALFGAAPGREEDDGTPGRTFLCSPSCLHGHTG